MADPLAARTGAERAREGEARSAGIAGAFAATVPRHARESEASPDSAPRTFPESTFDSRLFDFGFDNPQPSHRSMGWQLRVVGAAALIGCLAFFLLAQWLANTPHVDARWESGADGRVVLEASSDPSLRSHVGHALHIVRPAAGAPIEFDETPMQRSLRWIVDGDERRRTLALHDRLSKAMLGGDPTFVFDDGSTATPALHKRGSSTLGGMFWLLGAFALVLYLVAMVVSCSRPNPANLLYAIMAVCQVGNLVMIAIESTAELGLPNPVPMLDMPLRMSFDLLTAAAITTSMALHPRRLRGATWIGGAAFASAAILILMQWRFGASASWGGSQGAVLALGVASIGLLSWSHRLEPHPFAVLLRRLGFVIVGSLALLTLCIASTDALPRIQRMLADVGSTTWYVFFAALLLLVPFLSKSQQLMREFSMLAAISTIATSLDLMFVAVFSLGQFASLTLSLFLSLGVYAGLRQWVLSRLLGSSKLTTERMFEQLYRIAREVEVHPDLAPTLLSTLMRDLFEPLELMLVPRRTATARVFGAGSSMMLPVPVLNPEAAEQQPAAMSIVLRYAHRGRQLFTVDDARLADRIAEQLRRAVAFDKAVEQGRSEERARIAQDLHDDIGARLLTLMYTAASPEIEEYVRHTLKDLKTLTRGLAASHHPLSHAAAEWKADLSQRLTAAEIEIDWRTRFSHDMVLTVVQWSALTRILRELVSNTIAHSRATHVAIDLQLSVDGQFSLTVSDDGVGHDPAKWSHGLGLGGVRKRVKQLGGEVEWREASPRGIVCSVGPVKLAATS